MLWKDRQTTEHSRVNGTNNYNCQCIRIYFILGLIMAHFSPIISCTLPRVIQSEDYKNRKNRLAPLPTAYDKTSQDHMGYHTLACHCTIYATEAIIQFHSRS